MGIHQRNWDLTWRLTKHGTEIGLFRWDFEDLVNLVHCQFPVSITNQSAKMELWHQGDRAFQQNKKHGSHGSLIVRTAFRTSFKWLVAAIPLKNMTLSVGMMKFPIIYGSHKNHVPNHQITIIFLASWLIACENHYILTSTILDSPPTS